MKGAKGMDANQFRQASLLGVTKVNIDTDGRLVWTRVHREFSKNSPKRSICAPSARSLWPNMPSSRSSPALGTADTAGLDRLLQDGTACRLPPGRHHATGRMRTCVVTSSGTMRAARRRGQDDLRGLRVERMFCSTQAGATRCAPPTTPPISSPSHVLARQRGPRRMAAATFVSGPTAAGDLAGPRHHHPTIRSTRARPRGSTRVCRRRQPLPFVALPMIGTRPCRRVISFRPPSPARRAAAQCQQLQHHAGPQPARPPTRW